MPVISSPNLTTLRTAVRQSLTVYASILVPRDLWSARVNNGTPANGDTSIPFDGGAGLSFGNVEAVQEVWVGSAAGLDDIGRVRIKGISSGDGGVTGTLTASANSLEWVDNAYLTFKHDYPLKPRFPFIEENGDFKKDGDVAYTDETIQPPPVCIAGNHRAKFLSGGSAVFNVDLTDSYAIADGATISSYSASVYPSSGVTVSVTAGVGTITFTVAGQYWCKFSCTDSNGKSQTTYRSYFVHSTDKTSADYPFNDFNIGQMTGDWDRGGWECGIKVADNAALDDIPDKTLVVLWGDWVYGTSSTPITFLPDSDNAVLVGYIRKFQESHNLSDGSENVDFQITTAEALLRQKYNFSVSQEVVNVTPTKWYEYEEWMTVGRVVHHFYKYHSTLFEVADVLGLMDIDTLKPYAELEDGDMYATGDSFARDRSLRQHLVCDRGGILRLAQEQQLLPDANRSALTTVAELLKTDRSGPITMIGEPENRVAFVHVSGFGWDGTFDANGKPAVQALCAIAPGDKPADDGPSTRSYERQTFTGQTHANQIAGRVYAMENNYFREVRVNLHGNYLGVMEPCLSEQWELSLLTTETPREIVWANKPIYLRSVTVQFNHAEGRVSVSAVFEPEADGGVGKSTDCPTWPGFDGGFEIPDYTDQGGAIATAASFNYLAPSKKSWSQLTAEATQHAYPDPFWTTTQNSFASAQAIIWRCGVGFIKRSTDGGNNWTAVTPGTNPPNDAGDTPAPTVGNVTFVQGEGSVVIDQTHVFIARWQNASNEWRSWLVYTADDGATWTWVSVNGGSSPASTPSYAASPSYIHPDHPQLIDMGNNRIILAFMALSGSAFLLINSTDATILDIGETGGGSLLATFTVIAKLTDTELVVVNDESDTPLFESRVYDISGDTFTGVAKTTIQSGVGTIPSRVSVARLSDTDYLIAYNKDSSATSQLMGIVAQFNGVDTITYGTPVVIHNEATTYFTLLEGTVGTHCYFQDNSLTSLRGIMLTVTGTVITVNSSIDVRSANVSYVAACIVSGDKAVVFFADSADSNNLWLRVVTLGTGSATMSNTFEVKNAAVTAVSAAQMGTDAGVVAFRHGTNTLSYVTFTTLGHAITLGAERDYPISGFLPLVGNVSAGLILAAVDSNNSNRMVAYIPGTGNIKAMGLSVGKALSEVAYVTGWSNSEELTLSVIDLVTPATLAAYSLGTATEAELDARSWVAFPHVPFAFDDGFVYLYGRMNPIGIGTVHVMYSEDAGASWTIVEAGWGSDHCGSLVEDFGTLYAMRNISGAQPKLFVGDSSGLSVKSTLSRSAFVNPSGMVYDWFSGTIHVGFAAGGSIMVIRANAPFTEWVDITYNHSTGNGIKAIMVL